MRAGIMLLITLAFQSAIAQVKFAIGSNGDYSVLVNDNVITKTTVNPNGGYVDYYILRDDAAFTYMLSITKVILPNQDHNIIYTDDFRKKFLSECNCEIIDHKNTSFNNFTGVIFKIKSDLEGKIVKGYSVSTITSGVLFSINFFALETAFDSLTSEYQRTINSLVFK